MAILGLRVVGPTVAAALVASTSAWWFTPALCHTSRPETTATYTAERGSHVAKFQSVDRTSESEWRGGGRGRFGRCDVASVPMRRVPARCCPTHPPPPLNATSGGGGGCVECEWGGNHERGRVQGAATAGGSL